VNVGETISIGGAFKYVFIFNPILFGEDEHDEPIYDGRIYVF